MKAKITLGVLAVLLMAKRVTTATLYLCPNMLTPFRLMVFTTIRVLLVSARSPAVFSL